MNNIITPLIKPLKFPLGLVHPLLEDPSLEVLYLFDGHEGGQSLVDISVGNCTVTVSDSSLNLNQNALCDGLIGSVGGSGIIGGTPYPDTTDWVEFDFGAGNEKELVSLTAHAYSGGISSTHSWRVQYHDTGWQDIDNTTFTLVQPTDSIKTVSWQSVGARQMWRMRFVSGTILDNMVVNEVQWYERSGSSDKLINYAPAKKRKVGYDNSLITTNGVTVVDITKINDGTETGYANRALYIDGSGSLSDVGDWIQFDFGRPVDLTSFTVDLIAPAYSDHVCDYNLQASSASDMSGAVSAFTNKSVNLGDGSSSGQERTTRWSSVGKHRYWRLTLTSNTITWNYGGIIEWKWYGSNPSNRDGTLNGALWRSNSLLFDGDDAVVAGTISNLAIANDGPISIIASVNRDNDSGTEAIITYEKSDAEGWRFLLLASLGSIGMRYIERIVAGTNNSLDSIFAWGVSEQVVVGVSKTASVEPTDWSLYLNGNSISTVLNSNSLGVTAVDYTAAELSIGASIQGTSQHLSGNIAGIAIFTRTLSSSEQKQMADFFKGLV